MYVKTTNTEPGRLLFFSHLKNNEESISALLCKMPGVIMVICCNKWRYNPICTGWMYKWLSLHSNWADARSSW